MSADPSNKDDGTPADGNPADGNPDGSTPDGTAPEPAPPRSGQQHGPAPGRPAQRPALNTPDLRWHQPDRPPTTQAFVLTALRRAITSGALAPGQPIRQDSIAHDLGVSRVPLREALKTLEAEGQVVYRPHRGYSVAELSLADLLEVYRIRDLLESEAARTAVAAFTDADLSRITDAAEDVARAAADADLVGMISANRRFHFALLEPSSMPRLLRMVRTLWDATDAYRAVYYNSEANRERVRAEHDAIVAAAVARDADALVAELRTHRDHAVDSLRDTIRASG